MKVSSYVQRRKSRCCILLGVLFVSKGLGPIVHEWHSVFWVLRVHEEEEVRKGEHGKKKVDEAQEVKTIIAGIKDSVPPDFMIRFVEDYIFYCRMMAHVFEEARVRSGKKENDYLYDDEKQWHHTSVFDDFSVSNNYITFNDKTSAQKMVQFLIDVNKHLYGATSEKTGGFVLRRNQLLVVLLMCMLPESDKGSRDVRFFNILTGQGKTLITAVAALFSKKVNDRRTIVIIPTADLVESGFSENRFLFEKSRVVALVVGWQCHSSQNT